MFVVHERPCSFAYYGEINREGQKVALCSFYMLFDYIANAKQANYFHTKPVAPGRIGK